MAKIRGIKPEFWTDEDIVELSLPARLLFIGLWNLACDNGHVPDKPKQIKMRLMPADDVDVDQLLTELEKHDRLERTQGTIFIHNFAKHQKPHRRWWTVCDLPLCEVPEDAPEQGANRGGKGSGTTSQPGRNSGATVAHGRTTADGDGEGDVDSEVKVTRKRAATRLPDTWQPSEKHWERRHDGIDVQREADKFRLHAEANDRRVVNWNAAFSQWLLNARPTTTPTLPIVADSSQLPPVEDSWMRRRPR